MGWLDSCKTQVNKTYGLQELLQNQPVTRRQRVYTLN